MFCGGFGTIYLGISTGCSDGVFGVLILVVVGVLVFVVLLPVRSVVVDNCCLNRRLLKKLTNEASSFHNLHFQLVFNILIFEVARWFDGVDIDT